MEQVIIDGNILKHLMQYGLSSLLQNKKIVNDLNVFPIPDGDTGENMYLTLQGGVQAIKDLKRDNIWVYAADMDGDEMYRTNLKGDIAIVIGGEGSGVKRLTKEICDGVISIPMFGKVNSLNASVSAGITLYEAVRQRKN